jgi:hypothetical protein
VAEGLTSRLDPMLRKVREVEVQGRVTLAASHPKGLKTKTSTLLAEYIRNRLLHKSVVTPLEVMTEFMRRSYHAHNYDLALEAATRAASPPYRSKQKERAIMRMRFMTER